MDTKNWAVLIAVAIIILLIIMWITKREYFSPYVSVLSGWIFRSDGQFDQHLSKEEVPVVPF